MTRTLESRVRVLVRALGRTPGVHVRIEKETRSNTWWIVGDGKGDLEVPGTAGAVDLVAAVEAAERHLRSQVPW